jgi:hypothetical protein
MNSENILNHHILQEWVQLFLSPPGGIFPFEDGNNQSPLRDFFNERQTTNNYFSLATSLVRVDRT